MADSALQDGEEVLITRSQSSSTTNIHNYSLTQTRLILKTVERWRCGCIVKSEDSCYWYDAERAAGGLQICPPMLSTLFVWISSLIVAPPSPAPNIRLKDINSVVLDQSPFKPVREKMLSGIAQKRSNLLTTPLSSLSSRTRGLRIYFL